MSRLQRIAIVGSGIGAWMAAAYLARQLKRQGTEIVQVSAGAPVAPAVVASLPSLDTFHAALGFDLRDLMRACGASFRLGTRYEATGGIHAYGETGQAFGAVPFHLAWQAHAEDVSPDRYGDHSLAAQMAAAGRFTPPGGSEAPGMGFSPGLHLDGSAYLEFLKKAALHYGVKSGSSLGADGLDAETGTVRLEGGGVLEGDLILDTRVSDPSADWIHAAPLPAKLSVRWTSTSGGAVPLGLSSIRTVPGGAIVDVPMMDSVWRAHNAAQAGAGFIPGWHDAPWRGRCVRIGDAACRLPPGEAPELRIIQAGLETLAGLLPGGAEGLPECSEYNRLMKDTFRALADFASLSFLDPAMGVDSLPDTLALRLQNFISRGRIILLDGESFNRDSWASAMIASGWKMKRADAHAAALPPERVKASLRSIAGALAATCETLPDQRDFLRRAGIHRRAHNEAT